MAPKVSIVIPTLNEEKSIGGTLDSIPEELGDYEVIIVDGNSPDRTREIAESKGARVIVEPRKGYGRAHWTGMLAAKGDIICTMDGDMTYPAHRFPEMVELLDEKDIDFITCDRLTMLDKNAMRVLHRIGNFILTFFTRLLFGVKIWDSQSGMWVFRKEVLEGITMTDVGMPFSEEIKIEAFQSTYRAVEIPVEYYARVGDPQISTWGDGTKNLKFLFRKKAGKLGGPLPP